jgi:hypothetical protein
MKKEQSSMRPSKMTAISAILMLLLLLIAVPALADTYIFDPAEVIVVSEDYEDFTFGKSEFDPVGFNAQNGFNIKLVVRHKHNSNDSAVEQWGLWFHDDAVSKTFKIKSDPNHLLDESGSDSWINSSFKLTKSKITDVLYSNSSDWWFILKETITNVEGNDLMFDKAKLVVTAPTPTPIPGALWLFGSGLALIVGARRRFRR